MNAKEIYEGFRRRMRQYDDQELIGCFNNEVGKQGWGTARSCYLSAIHAEWIARGFDFSMVGDSRRLSFRHKVTLADGVVRY
jgi:hypothetical protein